MTWIVVKFEEENTVEAVPKSWYDSMLSRCYWPPTSTVHAKICEYIKNKNKPDKKWKNYPARILGLYDDFQMAQRKADKARTTNDLTSQNEETMQDKLPRRKKSRKQPRRCLDSSSERDSTDHNSDSNMYPDVASLNSKTVETGTDNYRPKPGIPPRLFSKNLSRIDNSGMNKRDDDNSDHSDEHRWNSPTARSFTSPNKHREENTSTQKQKVAPSFSTSNFETAG